MDDTMMKHPNGSKKQETQMIKWGGDEGIKKHLWLRKTLMLKEPHKTTAIILFLNIYSDSHCLRMS